MKDPTIGRLQIVRRQAEDSAAVTHELVSRDAEGLRLLIALDKAPMREQPKRLKAVADFQQATAVLHMEAYRLARALAGTTNAIIEQEAA